MTLVPAPPPHLVPPPRRHRRRRLLAAGSVLAVLLSLAVALHQDRDAVADEAAVPAAGRGTPTTTRPAQTGAGPVTGPHPGATRSVQHPTRSPGRSPEATTAAPGRRSTAARAGAAARGSAGAPTAPRQGPGQAAGSGRPATPSAVDAQNQRLGVSSLEHSVQPVYLVPSGSARGNLADEVERASLLVQEQWAGWGWSYRLRPVRTVRSERGCSDFRSSPDDFMRVVDAVRDEVRKVFGDSPRTVYTVWVECSDTGWAAHGGGDLATFYAGALDALPGQLEATTDDRDAIGVIGHELGHVFGLPHENCGGETANAAVLARLGLPSGPTHSLMCNSTWPAVNPPEPYQRAIVERTGCRWLRECGGGRARG